jgi:hypothetical protein
LTSAFRRSVAEQSRKEWSLWWIDALLRDLRFAWRLLVRQPMFAAAAILTVAFGVGANTAVVSVLETVLLNPLGLRDADKVMVARTQFAKLQLSHAEASGVEFREIQSLADVFSAAAATEGRAWTWLADGEASRLLGQAVTPDFFRVFGEHPSSGRFFMTEDNDRNVVLSDGLWRSRFGADPSAVGRAMMLDNQPYRIVGVAPAGFRFPAQAQLWTPLLLEPKRQLDAARGTNVTLSLFARRKDGVSAAQAVDRVKRYVDGLKSDDAAHGSDLAKYGYDIEMSSLGLITHSRRFRSFLMPPRSSVRTARRRRSSAQPFTKPTGPFQSMTSNHSISVWEKRWASAVRWSCCFRSSASSACCWRSSASTV